MSPQLPSFYLELSFLALWTCNSMEYGVCVAPSLGVIVTVTMTGIKPKIYPHRTSIYRGLEGAGLKMDCLFTYKLMDVYE